MKFIGKIFARVFGRLVEKLIILAIFAAVVLGVGSCVLKNAGNRIEDGIARIKEAATGAVEAKRVGPTSLAQGHLTSAPSGRPTEPKQSIAEDTEGEESDGDDRPQTFFDSFLFLASFLRGLTSGVINQNELPLSKDEPTQSGSIRVLSWNLKHLGRDGMDMDAVQSMISKRNPDVVAVQEVNTTVSGKDAAMNLARRISTKEDRYCLGLSQVPTGAKERYAILWKESRLSFVTSSGAVKDRCQTDPYTLPLFSGRNLDIVREPSFVVLMDNSTKKRFIVASIHLVPTAKKPEREIEPLIDSLPKSGEPYAGYPIIVAGDFNLGTNDRSFAAAWKSGFKPALGVVPTSLSKSRRKLNKPYDSIIYKGVKCGNGVVLNTYAAFPQFTPDLIYITISDHAPISADCSL